jgi:hypothetical protein
MPKVFMEMVASLKDYWVGRNQLPPEGLPDSI